MEFHISFRDHISGKVAKLYLTSVSINIRVSLKDKKFVGQNFGVVMIIEDGFLWRWPAHLVEKFLLANRISILLSFLHIKSECTTHAYSCYSMLATAFITDFQPNKTENHEEKNPFFVLMLWSRCCWWHCPQSRTGGMRDHGGDWHASCCWRSLFSFGRPDNGTPDVEFWNAPFVPHRGW